VEVMGIAWAPQCKTTEGGRVLPAYACCITIVKDEI